MKQHRTVLCVVIHAEKVNLTFYFSVLELLKSQGLSVMSASGSLQEDLVAVFVRDHFGLLFVFY